MLNHTLNNIRFPFVGANWTGQEMQQGFQASQPYVSAVGNEFSADSSSIANAAGSLLSDLGGLFS